MLTRLLQTMPQWKQLPIQVESCELHARQRNPTHRIATTPLKALHVRMGASMRVQVFVMMAMTLMLGGCASIVSGQNQSVSVVTKTDGADVAGAKCSLSNDKGQWYATTPGSVTVRRSYGALAVDCKTDSHAGTAQVKSTTKGMAFGNILFGGVIGVGVDVATGAAYDYPEVISVPLVGIGSMTGSSTPSMSPVLAPAAVVAVSFAPPPQVPAPPPAPAVPPVSATVPPSPPIVAMIVPKGLPGGQDAFQASRVAQGSQCHANPIPIMIGKGPGNETYSVTCANGDTLAIKCEFGTCRALK